MDKHDEIILLEIGRAKAEAVLDGIKEGREAEREKALKVMEGLEDILCQRDNCQNRIFSCDLKDAIKAYREGKDG